MQPKKQEIFDHFLLFRLHTLVFSCISSGVSFILYGVLHIVVIRIVQQPFLLINHLTFTPVLLLYLIHISKLLFAIHYPGSLTASNLSLGGSFTRSSNLCIWMTTVWCMGRANKACTIHHVIYRFLFNYKVTFDSSFFITCCFSCSY